ncbi:MAG: SDR family NAD(P)-dependent oxidoreductase [Gammaproteobacteria bacterium]|nr:SDR family NAD(P)-dependent oxidoreductase [Gammaproteobacteria bacterium]
MQHRFEDKRVLVTGASRGIGRAIAERLASEGARVCVHYGHDEEAAQKVLDGLAGQQEDSTRHCLGLADLTDPIAVRELAKRAIQELGGVDVLVNNAGVFFDHPIDQQDYEEWQESWARTFGVNLFGPANLIHQIVPHMIEAGGGRIINISSRGAFRGEPVSPAYGASKAGLNSLSQSLAVALAPHHIQVMGVAPGFVETEMTEHMLEGESGDAIRAQSPMNRVAKPEEVAATVAWLASAEAEFVSGTIIDVNGASYLRS